MKSKLLSMLAAIGLIATAASADMKTISGTVTAKDVANETVMIETDTGEKMLFKTAPTTVLKDKDGNVVATTSVSVGDRVEISVDPASTATPALASQVIVIVPVASGIVTAPGTDRVDSQTDNTGKNSGYRPSQQVPADAD